MAAKKDNKPAGAPQAEFTEMPRLKERYLNETVPALKEKFGYKNVMEIPKLEKIIVNMGLGAEKDNPKGIESAANSCIDISQNPAKHQQAKGGGYQKLGGSGFSEGPVRMILQIESGAHSGNHKQQQHKPWVQQVKHCILIGCFCDRAQAKGRQRTDNKQHMIDHHKAYRNPTDIIQISLSHCLHHRSHLM